jgi:acyl-coenzyme A thioesterase PaaI-like protein
VEEIIAIGQKVLASQPFSVLIGAQLIKLEAGAVEIHIPVKEELNQQYGFMHGGVVSYATAEFKINFLKPCVGKLLAARASVIHQGKRSAVCRCEIFMIDGEGEKLCAVAQGTVSTLES